MADDGMQQIVGAFEAVLSGVNVRQGEEMLGRMSHQNGFGLALVNLVGMEDAHPRVRHIASIYLRQHVEKHWSPDMNHTFVGPELSEDEKAGMRDSLLPLLQIKDLKLQRSVGDIVGAIGGNDFPDQWGDLLEILVIRGIKESGNPDLIRGALYAISIFAREIHSELLMETGPVLFPTLLEVVQNQDKYDVTSRASAMRIYATLLKTCGETFDSKKDINQLLQPTVEAYADLLIALIHPENAEQIDDPLFEVRMHSLKAVMHLVIIQRKALKKKHGDFIEAVFLLMQALYPMYEERCINNMDEDGVQFDSDGEEIGLEALIAQSLEFFHAVVENRYLVKLIQSNLQSFIDLLLPFLQYPVSLIDLYEEEPAQFVHQIEDEDFMLTFSIRSVIDSLIHVIISNFEMAGIASLLQSSQGLARKAQEEAKNNNENWWKYHEASMYVSARALNALAEDPNSASQFNISSFCCNTLLPLLTPENDNPYLYSTALWATGQVFELVLMAGEEPLAAKLGECLAEGIQVNAPDVCRVSAMYSFGLISIRKDAELLAPVLPLLGQVFASVCSNLEDLDQEVCLYFLNNLFIVVVPLFRINVDLCISVQEPMCDFALNAWYTHDNHPEIPDACCLIVTVFLEQEPTSVAAQQQVVPKLQPLISNPENFSSVTVYTAIDMVASVLQAAKKLNASPHPILVESLLPQILVLTCATDDSYVLESCIGCCCKFLALAADQISSVTFNGTSAIELLINVFQKVLDLSTPESGIGRCGPLLRYGVVRLWGDFGDENMFNIMVAIVKRLHCAVLPVTKSNIISLFGYMIQEKGLAALDLLGEIGEIECDVTDRNGDRVDRVDRFVAITEVLQTMVSVEHASSAHEKLNLLALSQLLHSMHEGVYNMTTNGYPIVTDGGSRRMTRSRVKATGGDTGLRYTEIPYPTKILSMLLKSFRDEREKELMKAKQYVDSEDEEDTDASEDDEEELQFISSLLDDGDNLMFEEEGKNLTDDEENEVNTLVLFQYIPNVITAFRSKDEAVLQQLADSLDEKDQETLMQVLQM